MRQVLRQSQMLRGLVGSVRQLPGDLHRLRGALTRASTIRDYLEHHDVRKIQIGAGPNELPGWLNADFHPVRQSTIYLDATKRFPMPSESFDYVFSEHMIEHVTFADGMKMLLECQRIMKPGATIRIATPNLRNISALENDHPSEEQRRYVAWAHAHHVQHSVNSSVSGAYRPAYVINNFFWGFGHYFVYDPETLTDALAAAGFKEMHLFKVGESDDKHLVGLETHADLIGKEFNLFETMVIQATKPRSR